MTYSTSKILAAMGMKATTSTTVVSSNEPTVGLTTPSTSPRPDNIPLSPDQDPREGPQCAANIQAAFRRALGLDAKNLSIFD